jgi:hypothetical protein
VFRVPFAILEKLIIENRELALRYSAALQKMYRKKSEKISAEQLALFLAQLPTAEAKRAHVEVEPVPAVADAPPAQEPKRRGGRKLLPDHLKMFAVPLRTYS